MQGGGVTAAFVPNTSTQPYFGSTGSNIADQAPTASIAGPPDPTDATAGSFTWTAADPDDPATNLSFSCTLDATAGCGAITFNQSTGTAIGTVSYSGFAPGSSHTFSITVTDPWGRSTPASYTWRVFYDTITKTSPAVPNVPLSATVTRATDGAGVGGLTVDFYAQTSATAPSSSATSICSAVTNSSGVATCGTVTPTASAILAGGVWAKVRPDKPQSGSDGSWGSPSTSEYAAPYFISWGSAGVA
jgi:hypothetical protein